MRWNMVDPGLLIHQVYWQTETSVLDSFNQPSLTWVDSDPILAYVEPLTGRELWYAQQVNALISYRVTMRGGYAIKASDRIRWGSLILQVVSVIKVDGRDEMLWVDCSNKVA